MDLRGVLETPGVAVTASNRGRLVFGYIAGTSEVIVWAVDTDGAVTQVGNLTQLGTLIVADADPATKAYRFRTAGSALDLDFAGASATISTFQNPDFSGAQRTYMVLEAAQDLARCTRRWTWAATDPFGAVVHQIDPQAGTATLSNLSVTGSLATTAAGVFGGQISAPAAIFGTASADAINSGGALTFTNVGAGIRVKEGANAKMGVATLAAGTVTVNTTAVAATSRIQLTVQSLGTVANPQAVAVTARTAGTSFTIRSADATDTSVVAWLILDPSP